MHGRTLEVPVDSLDAALRAAPFATRLELCDDLASEGWSPDPAFVRAVRAATGVHLVAMVRPRIPGAVAELVPAAFRSSPSLIEANLREIEAAARCGADSVAVSLLDGDGHVDRDGCGRLVEAARAAGLQAAFLRTFDLLADRDRGMRDLTQLGFVRVVTAGVRGWDASVATLERRIAAIARDAANALREAGLAGRSPVEVVPGGGVRAANAGAFLEVSPHLHASCRRDGRISDEELAALHAALGRRAG